MRDLTDFDFVQERWDLVESIFAHVPPRLRRSLLRRVVASLKSGGVLLLEAYTPDQVGSGTEGPPVVELTTTVESLREELAPLEFVHAQEPDRDVLEGTGHTGHGAVVQVIARKPAKTDSLVTKRRFRSASNSNNPAHPARSYR